MNNYFTALREALRGLSPEERDEAVSYYKEYAMDAGYTSGDEMENAFGNPKELASKIYAENALKRLEQPQKAHWKTFSMGLLALFAVPMTFPLVLIAGIVIFVLALLLFIFVMVFGSLTVAFIASAGWLFFQSITLIISAQYGSWLIHLGLSLMFLSIAVLIIATTYVAARYALRELTRIISNRMMRR